MANGNEIGVLARVDLNSTIILAKAALSVNALIQDMKDVLTKAWKKQSREGIISALRLLEGDGPLSTEDLDVVLGDMEKHLGSDLQSAVRKPVVEVQEAAYLSGGADAVKQTGADFKFGMKDRKSLLTLNENTMFWVGDYFKDDLQGEVRGSLEKLFTGGYQRREVMRDLKLALEDKLPRSDSYWDLLADHTATKIRTIGQVAGYEQVGIMAVRIRARIDHKTTEMCRRLHGHIIATEDLRGQVNRYLAACETKNKDAIKASWPWWNDKQAKTELTSVDSINRRIKSGEIALPPYHARCRTITVAEMILEPGSHDVPPEEQGLFEDGKSPIGGRIIEPPKRKE